MNERQFELLMEKLDIIRCGIIDVETEAQGIKELVQQHLTQQDNEPSEIFSQDVCSYCQHGSFMSCKDERCKSVMSGRIAFNGKKLLQLKTEIRALIPKVYQAYYDADVTPEMFEPVIERLRELSAV